MGEVGWWGCLKERSSVELRPLYGHTKLGSEVEGYAYLRLRPSPRCQGGHNLAFLLLAPRLRPRALRPGSLFPFHPHRRSLSAAGLSNFFFVLRPTTRQRRSSCRANGRAHSASMDPDPLSRGHVCSSFELCPLLI